MNTLKINYHKNKTILGKNLNIIYLNINSLRYKLQEIELIIERYAKEDRIIHFIALTEIKLDELENQYYNIRNYNAFFSNKSRNSGGVALYCHQSIPCSVLASRLDHNMNFLCVFAKSFNIKIIIFYKQPSVNFEIFLNYLDNILDNHKRFVLLGDLNVDILRDSNAGERYLSMLTANSCYVLNKIHLTMATRVAHRGSHTSRTIIDHAITDITHFDFNVGIHHSPLSDHEMITLSINTNDLNPNYKKCSPNYPTSFIDYTKFRNLLLHSESKLSDISDSGDFNELFKFFKTLTEQSTITNNNIIGSKPAKTWVSDELLNLIAERDRYYCLHKNFWDQLMCMKSI